MRMLATNKSRVLFKPLLVSLLAALLMPACGDLSPSPVVPAVASNSTPKEGIVSPPPTFSMVSPTVIAQTTTGPATTPPTAATTPALTAIPTATSATFHEDG